MTDPRSVNPSRFEGGLNQDWSYPRRRHKGLGQKSPINFAKDQRDSAAATHLTVAELP